MGNKVPSGLQGFSWTEYFWKDKPIYNEPPVHGPGFKDTKGKHFPPGVRIPDWRKYKLEDAPELLENQRKLAALGLRDNWARNDVWRFSREMWGTNADKTLYIFRSFKYGFVAFVVTVALCETILKDKDAHHHHESIYKKDGYGHGHSDAHEHFHIPGDKYKLLHERKQQH